ncbi:MAG: hypothetical protein WC662_00325 [Candidatus Paceibacterota bacterium]|jgi:hypothetical protein
MENEIQNENKNENKIKHVPVQTYADDIAKVVNPSEGGLIKKIIHQQEEYEKQKKELSPESSRNRIFMFVSIGLVALAILSVIAVVLVRQQIITVAVQPQYVPIIFTDKASLVEISGLDKDQIARTVFETGINTKVKNDGVEGIYLTENKKAVGLRKFISNIEGGLVQEKITYVSDNFLIGVVNDGTKDLFILLKMRAFIDIFDAMKTWENKMFYDLHGFFGIETNLENNYLLTKSFEDGIIQNKNARILRDNDGKILFMYVFADDNSVIITNTENATREIILRLASSQIRK